MVFKKCVDRRVLWSADSHLSSELTGQLPGGRLPGCTEWEGPMEGELSRLRTAGGGEATPEVPALKLS